MATNKANDGVKLKAIDEGMALVNKEMILMNLKERDKVYFDVHGVADEPSDETPAMINQKLQAMNVGLQRAASNTKQAYELACKQNTDFVKHRCLVFLKVVQWDVDAAVARMLKNFELRRKLFGDALLTRTLVQDDLDSETKDILYSGQNQTLPFQDSGGRLIQIFLPALWNAKWSLEARLRSLYFEAEYIALEDTVLKRGTVQVSYFFDHKLKFPSDLPDLYELCNLYQILPYRASATHICYRRGSWSFIDNMVLSTGMMWVDQFTRHRTRVSSGSHTEVKFKLQTFGIPVYCLPFDQDGTPTNKSHQFNMAKRMERERFLKSDHGKTDLSVSTGLSTINVDFVLNNTDGKDNSGDSFDSIFDDYDVEIATIGAKSPPVTTTTNRQQPSNQHNSSETPAMSGSEPIVLSIGPDDVLLGRGSIIQNHIGNVKYRHVIQTYKSEYDSKTKRSDKTRLSQTVVVAIKERGGRFLKQQQEHHSKHAASHAPSIWTPVEDKVALRKVAHSFRERVASNSTSPSQVPPTDIRKRSRQLGDTST